MLRNGVLKKMLDEGPQLRHLMLHNIDTLGANLDAELLEQCATMVSRAGQGSEPRCERRSTLSVKPV